MDSGLQTTLLIVAAVAAVAWLTKTFSGEKKDEDPAHRSMRETVPSGAEVIEDEDDDDDEEPEGMDEVVAIDSDGWAFVPDRKGVELIPPGDSEDDFVAKPSAQTTVNPTTGKAVTGWKPGEHLARGDLVDARIVRGAPDHDPWRLEALGRDRDYRAWRFETEGAAQAALALVTARVVRPPLDEDGDPIPFGAEDYLVAKREADATEEDLAIEPIDEKEEN